MEDLRAEVYDSSRAMDPGAMVLATSTETVTEAATIRDLVVTPGTYLLRLDRGAQITDPDVVTGTWVRCGVIVAPPRATP